MTTAKQILERNITAVNDALAADWPFEVGGSPAFEFLIDDAVVGERVSREAWPPSYTTWSADQTIQP
jgi:hypothetical protein